MLLVPDVDNAKIEPIVASTNVVGGSVKVLVTVKPPHFCLVLSPADPEPETLSYQRAVLEEAEVSTDVVMSGCLLAVIVAVKQLK